MLYDVVYYIYVHNLYVCICMYINILIYIYISLFCTVAVNVHQFSTYA